MNMIHPIDNIKWIDRKRIIPNDYNPNRMFPAEFKLLVTSILEDGWLFPILVHGNVESDEELKLIDGFHRHKASGTKAIIARDNGLVPVTTINGRSYAEYMARTVRMNRAKGEHGVEGMSKIVLQMMNDGWTAEKIIKEMGMEKEEVRRLALQEGIPASKLFSDEFSKSWIPKED